MKALLINAAASMLPLSLLTRSLPTKFAIYGHLISDGPHPVGRYYRFPSVDEFGSLVFRFKSLGYKFVGLEDFVKNDTVKKILLTFDDGYKVIFDEANSYLQRQNIPYILFVLSDSFENPDFKIQSARPEQDLDGDERLFLSLDEIRQLQNQGVHIGFHTRGHRRIEDTDNPKNPEIIKEVSIPEQYTPLFSDPLCFAYPYQAPENFHLFDRVLSEWTAYKYFFDTKGFRQPDSNHIFRVSIDAEPTIKAKKWLEFVIKRQLILYLLRKLRKG